MYEFHKLIRNKEIMILVPEHFTRFIGIPKTFQTFIQTICSTYFGELLYHFLSHFWVNARKLHFVLKTMCQINYYCKLNTNFSYFVLLAKYCAQNSLINLPRNCKDFVESQSIAKCQLRE